MAEKKAASMTQPTLTHRSPDPAGLTSVLGRNMQRMQDRRAKEEAQATISERVSDAITKFAGSMTFVIIHAIAYGTWIGINLGKVNRAGSAGGIGL